MKVAAHPDYPKLFAAMASAVRHVRRWEGTVFRSAPPEWSSGRNMLTGIGSFRAGGRFNAVESVPMVYASTTPELAMTESLAFRRRAGLPVEEAMPLVFKAIFVRVERLLDLTDPLILKTLGLTPAKLKGEAWWLARLDGKESLTQAVGRAAHAHRVQALLAASAHAAGGAAGQNVLVLPDHVSPPSELRVLRRPHQ